MDVKFGARIAHWTGAVALCFGTACPVIADEAIVITDDQSSTLAIAGDHEPALQPPAAQPAAEIQMLDHDGVRLAAASSRSDLQVAANRQATPRVAPIPSQIIVDPQVQVAGGFGDWINEPPSRPSASAGIRGMSTGGRYESDGGVDHPSWGAAVESANIASRGDADASVGNHAVPHPVATKHPAQKPSRQTAKQAPKQHAERAVASTPAPKAVAAPPTSAAPAGSAQANTLLIEAHQLSKQAKSQSDYTQVVRRCADAMRAGLTGESRGFALELSAWALNRRGQIRADENQIDLAMADFDAAIQFDGNCWRAYHNRSVFHAQTGQFAEAFDDVSHVIQLNPKFAKAYGNRAALYMQAGDTAKALADYDAALAINPKLVPALVGRGRLCHMQGDLDEALDNFTAALEVESNDVNIVCSRADLLADLGRYQDAMQDYAHAISLNPKFEHAYRNGAWLLATCPDASVRDVQGALDGAKKALECGYGERHAALDTLAAALANAGRYDEAAGTLRQALEIAPESARPGYKARLALYESGKPFRTEPVDGVRTADFVVGDADAK